MDYNSQLAVRITIIDMEEEKKKSNIGARVPPTKAEPEKVTNMVGTFLNDDKSEAAQRWFPRARHLKGIRKGRRYGDYLFE